MYKNHIRVGQAQDEMQLAEAVPDQNQPTTPPTPKWKLPLTQKAETRAEMLGQGLEPVGWCKQMMEKAVGFASVFFKQNDLKTAKGRTNMIKRELKS